MGSGSRLKFYYNKVFGLGIIVTTFPFAVTVNVQLLFWALSIGFGKGYDE